MTDSNAAIMRAKLETLRTELVDLGFVLECRGRLDAADVALTISARVAELAEEAGHGEAAEIPSCPASG